MELRVDGLRPGSEVRKRALKAVVVDSPGLVARREVPARPLEELRPGALDPGSLGAGNRVPADEAPSGRMRGESFDEVTLGRADVGDDGLVAAPVERLVARGPADGRRGAAQNTMSAPATASATVEAPEVMAPSSTAVATTSGAGSNPTTCASRRR